MKFVCQQQDLSKALNIVSKAVTVRSTIPVLRGILLEVNNEGKLTVSASDLDISIQSTLDVDFYKPGAVIADAKLFSDIIRKLPSAEVEIASDSNFTVTISSMNSNFNIVGMSADEFPVINDLKGAAPSVSFDKTTLKEMIEKTAFAASIDEARGIITGVLIEAEAGELRMIAIDGYRMAITRRNTDDIGEKSFVIPAKLLSQLAKIIGDTANSEGKGELILGEKKAVFILDNVRAELKILDGKFIAYKEILPKSSKVVMEIDRKSLMEGIERASLLSKAGKNNLVKLNIKDTLLTITSDSEEGNVKEEIAVIKDGNDLDIGFNAHYLMDILKSVDDDNVKMMFNSGVDPCLVEPKEGNEYEYLVLPVRIS